MYRTVTRKWTIRTLLLFFIVQIDWNSEFLLLLLLLVLLLLVSFLTMNVWVCAYINICLCKIHPIDYHMKKPFIFLFFYVTSVCIYRSSDRGDTDHRIQRLCALWSCSVNRRIFFYILILPIVYIPIHFLYGYIQHYTVWYA